MIRESKADDLPSILALWMESTIHAAIRSGIGKALVQHVQQRFSLLSLEVYQKNQSAVNFYHALGFRIEDGAWQEETHHPTWIMGWQADQTP